MTDITTFQPRNSLVLVRRVKQERTEAGIILPAGQVGDFAIGEIIDIGPGMPTEAGCIGTLDLEVGDLIMFQAGVAAAPLQGRPIPKKSTLTFKVGGEEVELLDERQIIGIINNGDS